MKIRTVLLAVAATSALSTAAFANSHDVGHPSAREQMSDRCSALESQYNSIIEGKMNMPKADKAEGLHAQGVDACQSDNSNIGVEKLEQALRALGAKPAA